MADPNILELGAGHGALSRGSARQHPTAQVTISDVNPDSVAAIAASDLGPASPRHGAHHRRHRDRRCRRLPSTWRCSRCPSITCRPSRRRGCWPKAPGWPPAAGRHRPAPTAGAAAPAQAGDDGAVRPVCGRSPMTASISSLRAYSPSALRALAAHADRRRRGQPGLVRPPGACWPPKRLISRFPCAVGTEPVASTPWAKRSSTPATAGRTGRSTGARCSCASTSSRPCWRSRVSSSTAADRHGDRVQSGRRRLPAGDVQPGGARRDRRSGVPDRIGRLQHRIQRSAASAARPHRAGTGRRGSGQPQCRRDQGQHRRRAHRDDRHPADPDARAPDRQLDEPVDALSGAQRLDLHRPRRGHPDRHRRAGAI